MRCFLTILSVTEVSTSSSMDLNSQGVTLVFALAPLNPIPVSSILNFFSKTLKIVYYVAADILIIPWIADLGILNCFDNAPYTNFIVC